MYSVEFFKRCNITQADCSIFQEQWQVIKGDVLTKRINRLGPISTVPQDFISNGFYPTQSMNGSSGRALCEVRKRLLFSSAMYAAAVTASAISAEEPSVGQRDNQAIEKSSRNNASELYHGEITEKSELAAIRESAIRSKLLHKLSEANHYGRHIRRQLLEKEAALLKCQSELALMETELQALVALAQEAASEGAKPGRRKINGKYIQSHLAVRLEELHERLLLQVQDIDAVRYRDVQLVWYGMAEAVQVMGSFDGWTQGEQMSPEDTGSFTKFSTTLKLRPGQYQIKFLVDGEWHLSPELPTIGEGMTVNNVLVVE